MRLSALSAITVAGALVFAPITGATATPPASAPIPKSTATEPKLPKTSSITLLTGDQVKVVRQQGQPDQVSFVPGKGSRSGTASVLRNGDHVYALPPGVAAQIATGRVDKDLFDVTTLLAAGYDDAHSRTLPVIVTYAGGTALARTRAVQAKPQGAKSSKALSSIGARAVEVDKSAGKFWKTTADATIKQIRLDHRIRAVTDQSVPQIGAPEAWKRGLTGKGVKVAVLDTGIDATHPDLTGRVIAQQNFSDSPEVTDHVGHGTHVAGILAGTGAASGGKYRGVAPDASLLNGKVLDDEGSGSESAVIAGMEWAVAQGAKVVNLSLGGGPTDGTDPVSQALDTLSAQSGALFVVAAGNCRFPQPETVSSPAAADAAVAVGNLARDGSVSDSSCRGPREGDQAIKPEISAPGEDIVAARAAGTTIGDPVDDNYTALSGTSMATPHVAGTAVLLAGAHPDWNAAQLKTQLISTADPQANSTLSEQGLGRVDGDQGTDTALTVDTAVLDFGTSNAPAPPPHPTKTLTYRNSGDTPIDLTITATMDTPGAAPTPATPTVVVPAHGQVSVPITANEDTTEGLFTGRIVATPGAGDPLVTGFRWQRKPELFKVSVTGLDSAGKPFDGLVMGGKTDGSNWIFDELRNGHLDLELPPGTYSLGTAVETPATDNSPDTDAVMIEPEFTVGSDLEIVFDARKTVPVARSVRGHDDLRPESNDLELTRKASDGSTLSGAGIDARSDHWKLTVSPTKPVTQGTLDFGFGGRLHVPPYKAQVVGGNALPVDDFFLGPRFTGVTTLTAFDAGTAAPEQLDGVKGKLAIVRAAPDQQLEEQVERAVDAGAAAVMMFDPATPGVMRNIYGTEDLHQAVFTTTRVAAAAVLRQLAHGPVRIKVTGVASSPVVYEQLKAWSGAVPQHPVYSSAQRDFALMDLTLGAPDAGTRFQETRYGRTEGTSIAGLWYHQAWEAPLRRKDYVLAGNVRWSQMVDVFTDGSDGSAEWFSIPASYRPGQQIRQRFFAPVATAGLPDIKGLGLGDSYVSRTGGELTVAIAPFMHGSDLFEWPYNFPSGTHQLTVRRNGVEVGTIDTTAYPFDVPQEAADYEITLDSSRAAKWWQNSTAISSVWKFRSAGGAEELMPMIVPDLDVPAATATGTVPAGKPIRIDFGLRHQAGSPTSAITGAKLEISYDGMRWEPLKLRALGHDKYTATVTNPPTAKSVDLRISATDAAGGSLSQRITHVYGLTL